MISYDNLSQGTVKQGELACDVEQLIDPLRVTERG